MRFIPKGVNRAIKSFIPTHKGGFRYFISSTNKANRITVSVSFNCHGILFEVNEGYNVGCVLYFLDFVI